MSLTLEGLFEATPDPVSFCQLLNSRPREHGWLRRTRYVTGLSVQNRWLKISLGGLLLVQLSAKIYHAQLARISGVELRDLGPDQESGCRRLFPKLDICRRTVPVGLDESV